MASFAAELEVDGQVYPVVLCHYSFTQATGARGRVNEKVRHGLLEIVLDVPDSDQLLMWASTPHYPLDGHVSFFKANEFMAHETVSFQAGQCVGYQELFEAGADSIGSYRCSLTIAAPQLVLTAGGPPQSAAARPPGQTTAGGLLASAQRGYAAVQKARATVATAQTVAHEAGQLAAHGLPTASALAAVANATGIAVPAAPQHLAKTAASELGAATKNDSQPTDFENYIPKL